MPKKDDSSGGKAPTMEYGTGLSDYANFVKYLGKFGTYAAREAEEEICKGEEKEEEEAS